MAITTISITTMSNCIASIINNSSNNTAVIVIVTKPC